MIIQHIFWVFRCSCCLEFLFTQQCVCVWLNDVQRWRGNISLFPCILQNSLRRVGATEILWEVEQVQLGRRWKCSVKAQSVQTLRTDISVTQTTWTIFTYSFFFQVDCKSPLYCVSLSGPVCSLPVRYRAAFILRLRSPVELTLWGLGPSKVWVHLAPWLM